MHALAYPGTKHCDTGETNMRQYRSGRPPGRYSGPHDGRNYLSVNPGKSAAVSVEVTEGLPRILVNFALAPNVKNSATVSRPGDGH